MSVALSAFNEMFSLLNFLDPPIPMFANFDLEWDPDPMDAPREINIAPPGVFMIPVPENSNSLQQHLLSMNPDHHEVVDETDVEVIPFRFHRPSQEI